MADVVIKNEGGTAVYYVDGVQVTRAQAIAASDPATITASVNEKALIDKALAALTANNTFLAIATPTNAQVSAQGKALTRQSTARLRLASRALSDTSGT